MYVCRPTDNLMRQTHLYNGLDKSVGLGRVWETRGGFLIMLERDVFTFFLKKKIGF